MVRPAELPDASEELMTDDKTNNQTADPPADPARVLRDPLRGELEVVRVLRSGRSFDVAQAREPSSGRFVTVRATRYSDPNDASERAARRSALDTEIAIGALGSRHLTPAPSLWEVGAGQEPVLVHDFVEGVPLDSWMGRNAPAGLELSQLLPLARQIALAVADLHEGGFVHGCLSPDHVVVGPEERVTLMGLGNARRRENAPSPGKENFDDAYSAPEVLNERSGKFETPRSDVYGFGLLLSFLATGERPTGEVSAPLTRSAYAALEEGPEGVALIVAKCIQPLQKNRLSPMRKIAELLTEETLPTARTPGFGALPLLAPWGVGDGAGLRVGHLSPGPLVDRPRPSARDDADAVPLDEAMPTPEVDPEGQLSHPTGTRAKRTIGWAVSAAVLAAALWVTLTTLNCLG